MPLNSTISTMYLLAPRIWTLAHMTYLESHPHAGLWIETKGFQASAAKDIGTSKDLNNKKQSRKRKKERRKTKQAGQRKGNETKRLYIFSALREWMASSPILEWQGPRIQRVEEETLLFYWILRSYSILCHSVPHYCYPSHPEPNLAPEK